MSINEQDITPEAFQFLGEESMRSKKMLDGMIETLLLVLTFACYQSCYAARYEKPDHINEIVKNFLTQNIQVEPNDTLEVKVNEANVTINVPACAKDIIAGFPANANREQVSSVELSCNDTKPWHVIVPVDVQVYTKVLVTKRTIAAKEAIAEEDLDYSIASKNRLYNGFFTRKEDVLGNQTAYLITAGTILTKKNIQQPILVSRNQNITIFAKFNSIMVSMQGVAKTDGALNSVIKVYNPSSKRTLDAIVVGPNKAQIVT